MNNYRFGYFKISFFILLIFFEINLISKTLNFKSNHFSIVSSSNSISNKTKSYPISNRIYDFDLLADLDFRSAENLKNYYSDTSFTFKADSVIQNNSNVYYYLIIDPKLVDIRIFWNSLDSFNIRTLSDLKKAAENVLCKELLFATNGGMYLNDYSPQGLLVIDGNKISQIDTMENKFGNFYIQPNGVFFIDSSGFGDVVTKSDYINSKYSTIKFATQSGPMVLIDGKVNDYFTKNSMHLNIRSGVGKIKNDNRLVFIISKNRVSFYDFSHIFLQFNCDNALYLDGAISEFFLPQLGLVKNYNHYGPIIGILK